MIYTLRIFNSVVLNGGWSDWSAFGPCRCENNTETRTRECNSPLPSRGGLNCTGEASESVDCTPEVCPGMYSLPRYMCIGLITKPIQFDKLDLINDN